MTPQVVSHVYIGIGSNLAEPRKQVELAISRLGAIKNSWLHAISPFYRSAPVGAPDQDDYVNAVAHLVTELAAEPLLDALQAIERAQGRVRDGTRWGPRTLDLDILLYNAEIIRSSRLTVPHPEMVNRAFVLEPLHAIAPNLSVPGFGALAKLRLAVDRSSVVLLENSCDEA